MSDVLVTTAAKPQKEGVMPPVNMKTVIVVIALMGGFFLGWDRSDGYAEHSTAKPPVYGPR